MYEDFVINTDEGTLIDEPEEDNINKKRIDRKNNVLDDKEMDADLKLEETEYLKLMENEYDKKINSINNKYDPEIKEVSEDLDLSNQNFLILR